MRKVISAEPMKNYRLLIKFDNGVTKIRDMSYLLDKPVFAFLKNTFYFNSVFIEYGAVTWKDCNGNEVDLCPDALYTDEDELLPDELEVIANAANETERISMSEIDWDNLEKYL